MESYIFEEITCLDACSERVTAFSNTLITALFPVIADFIPWPSENKMIKGVIQIYILYNIY